MSLRRLLHSNTMRSSASDYFIIYDNQHSFLHVPLRRAVLVAFYHNLRRTGSDRRRERISWSPFGEAIEHSLAGVNPQSFQPTIGSLADMLWTGGFSEISLLEKSMTPDGNGPAVLLRAEKTSTPAVGSSRACPTRSR